MARSHPDDVYLKTRQVQLRYGGCSHMFIERRLANDPAFPRPVFMGRLRFWKLSELQKWEASQVDRKASLRDA
jgi:predicted DNA-binding transcriptional regulator AlpA